MWFSVSLKSQRMLLAVVYRPPSDNSAITEYLNTYTLRKLGEFGAQSVVPLDVFDIYYTDWLGRHTTDTAGRHTLEMTNSLGLQQIVTEPTKDDQILELVITDLVSTATTFAKLGTSDYNPQS